MLFRPTSVLLAIRTIVVVFAVIAGFSVTVSAREVELVYAVTPTLSNWSLREFSGGQQVGKETGNIFGVSVSSRIPLSNSTSELRWDAESFIGSVDREQAMDGAGKVTGSGSLSGARALVDWGWRFGVGKEEGRKSVMPFVGSRIFFLSHPTINSGRANLMSADGRFGCRAEYQIGRMRNNRHSAEQNALTASIGFHMPLVAGGDASGGSIAPFAEAGVLFGASSNDRSFRVDAFLESIRLKGGANDVETTEADRIGLRFGWEF